MKNNKLAIIVIVFALTLTLSTFAAGIPTATAHTPPWTIPTYAYLVVSPNPIGVNQQVYVVMWLHGAPPTASGRAGDRWHDFTLEITKPDGTTEIRGPYTSDPTGSTYDVFTPTQIGRYTFVLKYSGQVLTLVNPQTGIAVSRTDPNLVRFGTAAFENDTFLPSEATTTLTVQNDPIIKIPDYPLPTSYWTYPIEGQNSAWASVASNWLQGAYLGWVNPNQQNLWQKDGIAPNTSHIMWTRPIELGGIVGGTTAIPEVGFYSGGSYEGRFTSSIIMNGMLFYQEPLGHSNNGGGYTAVDLRTGEVRWHRDDIGVIVTAGTVGTATATSTIQTAGPTFGQLYEYESPNQHGVVGGILWQTSTAAGITTWQGIDAFTGKWAFNLTKVPGGFEVYSTKGEIVRYVLTYNATTKSGTLGLWNNTAAPGELLNPGTTTDAWQWRPNGKVIDASTAYSWKVPITADLTGQSAPAIVSVIPGDIIIGTSCSLAWLGGVLTKTPDPMTFWAISDRDDGTRGQLLWIKNYPAPANWLTPYMGPVDPVSRVFALTYIETQEWIGYSVDTGDQLWGPVTGNTNDFSYYGSGRGGGQVGFVANGKLYTQGFGGEIIAYSMTEGKILWKYNNTNSGDETVWGNYPIFISAIADGKVYAFNNEHSPNYPLYKGERVRCIDATSGQEIWTMLGWAGQSGGPGTSTSILADGTLVYYNYYDNQIYAVGKGPSAITVTATPGLGNAVTVQGTVTDQSAGAKQLVQDGKFNIVPAVSDASQGKWMEYLYMQKPMPNAAGVQVKLTATASGGSPIDIGTVTSDANGQFVASWTPSNNGVYTITAIFEGSNAYWGSKAVTGISVQSGTTATIAGTGFSNADMAILVVVIIAVIISIITLLTLRKRK